MKKTTGRTDPRVPRIPFGTRQLGCDPGAADARAGIAAIPPAADSGVTPFDTAQADGFGTSERLLATALRPPDRSALIIAKGGLLILGGRRVPAALARPHDAVRGHRGRAMAKPPADGKTRHVGLSTFTATPGGESCCSTC